MGGDEPLLDDTIRVADAARAAGVEVDVFAGLKQVFQFGAGSVPESDAARTQGAAFLRRRTRTG